jgi:hypothetical protein
MNIVIFSFNLITALLISFSCFSQPVKPENLALNFIVENYHVPKFNPVYVKESDYINALFKKALQSYLTGNINQINKSEILKILAANSDTLYEDSPDFRRITMRRNICYSILWISENSQNSETYLKKAGSMFFENSEILEYGLEGEYAGFLILKLVVAHKKCKELKAEIADINNFINKYGNDFETKFLNDLKIIVNSYTKY